MFKTFQASDPAEGGKWHPLQIIPVFRRIRGGAVRNLFYTLIWNSLIALLLSTMVMVYLPASRFLAILQVTWLYSNAIGFLIHATFVVTNWTCGAWIAAWSPRARSAWYAMIAAPCVVLGYVGTSWFLRGPRDWRAPGGMDLQTMSVLVLLIMAMLAGVAIVQARVVQSDASRRREQLARAEAERLAADARLRLLQAQIEPHFLFNTLANVTSLIETEPQRAKRMLEDFTDFLRATLTSLREPHTTLRRERELLGAYLRVLKVRMGLRLEFGFAMDDEVLDRPFPAMVLQPLVENAVKHGLDPAVRGGTITVGARVVGGQLEVFVADDGAGRSPDARTGTGLGSVAERLRAEYGPAAALRFDVPPGGGTRVTVTMRDSAA